MRDDLSDDWEEAENEHHCDFVERLHGKWEHLERKTEIEFREVKREHSPISIGDDGEVEYVNFVWRHRNVHCETFLKVDLSDSKNAFRSSKILSKFDERMADYDKTLSGNMSIRAELAPHLIALGPADRKFATNAAIKDFIADIYKLMNDLDRDEWENKIQEGKRVLNGEKIEGYPTAEGEYKKRHAAATKNWESWGSGRRKWTIDKRMKTDRNMYVSDPASDMLRRPSFDGDVRAIYIAFDSKEEIIVFLDPVGIPWSYDEDIHQRMRMDSHKFYSEVKRPICKDNARHISDGAHLQENPAIKFWWSGSDHYGHWHGTGHPHDPILETSDSHKISATQRQLLLQFLKYTGGPMTRVLDFWFGVWAPDLRQRYRDIYANSPEFARLPPVNKDHPETYCLRVSVCNRPTDEHRDQSDIKGGLTGLVHLGDFKGMLPESRE